MKTKYSDLIEIRESAIAFKIHPEMVIGETLFQTDSSTMC